MASGRPNSGFDFASDDILCSYNDYVNQDSSNGSLSDPSKDFQKSRVSRSPALPSATVYNKPEESLNQELILTVERTMKKYSDNLMRFLEGISSRLSQLELYCYNLDKSIGEMRSDLVCDHEDADSKLKFLEKHLQEVHRSIQILRDKQELAETQKELAKLQLVQESSSVTPDERPVSSASDRKRSDDTSDSPNTQLALILHSQVAPHPSHPNVQQYSSAPQAVTQLSPYYLPSSQLPNPQTSYPPHESQYRVPQPSQSQATQIPQSQQYPQYQQQWSEQVSQPMLPPQLPPMMPPQQPGNITTQTRPPAPQSQVFPPHITNQSANPCSMPMQAPFPGIHQPGGGRLELVPYSYSGSDPQPSSLQTGVYPSQQGDVRDMGGSHPQISSGGTYMLYDHAPKPNRYPQGGYPPANPSLPNTPPPNSNNPMIRNSAPQQYVRGHPYNELIDKLVSMGYRSDHVVSVIQRLEESGQPVDFNSVLGRLNGHSLGSSQRSW